MAAIFDVQTDKEGRRVSSVWQAEKELGIQECRFYFRISILHLLKCPCFIMVGFG